MRREVLEREGLARAAARAARGDAATRLVAVTVPTTLTDPVAFLDAAGGETPRVLVEDPLRHITFAGVGAARTVTASGPHRFREADAALRHAFRGHVHAAPAETPAAPRALGGFAFDPDHAPRDAWAAFPSAWFVIPRVLLTVQDDRAWLTLTATVPRAGDADAVAANLRAEARKAAGSLVAPPRAPRPLARLDPAAADDATSWTADARALADALRAGHAEKVVLARAVDGPAAPDARVTDAVRRLASPGCARFLMEPEAGASFFGATPETLLAVNGRHAETMALAATVKRGATDAEDAALADGLLASRKERREHQLVVDAVRDGLAAHAETVDADATPVPARFAHVQHLRTRVTARLPRPGRVLPVAASLHPTPAVGGVPRDAALDHVRALEPTPRGWYAGAVGWVGPDGDGTLLVAIRSALASGARVRAYAGAGILPDSDPDAEFRETTTKLAPMVRALRGEDA